MIMKVNEPTPRETSHLAPELNQQEQALAAELRKTLDAAVHRPDLALDAALAKSRARALAPVSHRPLWVMAGGLALAASLAVFVVLPQALTPTPASRSALVLDIAAAPAEDLQFLEDMDMLTALEGDLNES
jgi:hypothetical protein